MTSRRAPVRTRELPSLWRRTAAGAVDLGLAAAVSALAIYTGVVRFDAWAGDGSLPMIEHVAVTLHTQRAWAASQLVILCLPLVFVHGFSAVLLGRSVGAWLFGLEPVDRDGMRAESGRLVVRSVLYLTWPATLFLAPLLVAVGPAQRGPHDVLSGVWVVQRRPRRGQQGGEDR